MENFMEYLGVGNFIALLLVLNVVFNGIADGIRDKDIKNNSYMKGILYHFFWDMSLLTLFTLIIVKIDIQDTWIFILSWVLIRFAVFDFFRNIFAEKVFYHIGDTSLYDKILKKLKLNKKFGIGILLALKMTGFIIALYLMQDYYMYK